MEYPLDAHLREELQLILQPDDGIGPLENYLL